MFLDVDGPLHVVDHGGAADLPLVLCVHGLAGHHGHWRPLAAELEDRARVLAVDLPGHGQSPRLERSASVAANVQLLGGVVDQLAREHSPDGRVTLVGHSMGAALALLHAGAHPEHLGGLALVAPPVPRSVTEPLTRTVITHAAVCALPPFGHRRLGRHLLADRLPASAPDDAITLFVEGARSVGMLTLRSRDYREAIRTVDCPTVILHGSQDLVVPAASLHRLTTLRPDWATHLLDGHGHSPHRHAPHLVAPALQELLAKGRTEPGTGSPATLQAS
jgi:pimeloyl-ACP methyl ester carboxylesterase